MGFYCLPVGAVNHVQAPAPVKIRAWRATRSRSWSSRDAGCGNRGRRIGQGLLKDAGWPITPSPRATGIRLRNL